MVFFGELCFHKPSGLQLFQKRERIESTEIESDGLSAEGRMDEETDRQDNTGDDNGRNKRDARDWSVGRVTAGGIKTE